MDYVLGKKIFNVLLVMMFFVTGCMPTQAPSTRIGKQGVSGSTGGTTSGNNASGGTTIDTSGSTITPKIEIRHLIEPNLSTDPNYSTGTGLAGGGSYVRKLTLPKNFAGRLYVAGINISTLASQHVKVRFKFGVSREPITINATVSRAPGITPSADIDVLVLDLRSEPFRDVRLSYDLFDYKDYATNEDPIQDNRNTDLYCRGLRLEDDHTFQGVGACDSAGEDCFYSYAKVLDQGLVKLTTTATGQVLVPITPTLPQSKSITGLNYYQDWNAQQLQKPLLDTYVWPYRFSDLAVPSGTTDSKDVLINTLGSITIGTGIYYYQGPYRLMNQGEWQYKLSQIEDDPAYPDQKRLFKKAYTISGTKFYYNSYLFPLAMKMDLGANVAHLSSSTPNGVRSEKVLSSANKTEWMDGANARAQSKNSQLEHIGSCNVSSSIEIIAKDNNGNEYIVSQANDVKLQLVRPTQIYTDTGNEVLYTNFKTCSSAASCGGSECCFNNRCWDQSLVSQCIDNSQNGNREIGEGCTTDFQCASLCCNRTSGLCSPHNSLISPAVLCSKPIGDFCIAKEWCQKSAITKCLIVKTGTNALGETTCRQQCYTTQEFGDCKNGVCVAPEQPVIETFDPNADGACDNAVPAPSF